MNCACIRICFPQDYAESRRLNRADIQKRMPGVSGVRSSCAFARKKMIELDCEDTCALLTRFRYSKMKLRKSQMNSVCCAIRTTKEIRGQREFVPESLKDRASFVRGIAQDV